MDTITYPDIERAANTILSRAHPTHPVLQTWVGRITTDPAYTTDINDVGEADYRVELRRHFPDYREQDFPATWTLATVLDENGYPRPTVGYPDHGRWFGMLLEERAHPSDRDDWTNEKPGDARFRRMMDEAITRLAWAVVDFRRSGRQAGDHAREMMGLGSPVAIVTSSLAAEVADYAGRIENAWATRLHDLEVGAE